MMDQADLDFGIYRIMNVKREEVENFLAHDLLPTIKDSLEAFQPDEFVALQKELKEIEKSPGKFSADYANEVKAKLEGAQYTFPCTLAAPTRRAGTPPGINSCQYPVN